MPRTARTPVKGNAHNSEMDDDNHDKGTKKKTSKERNDETNKSMHCRQQGNNM